MTIIKKRMQCTLGLMAIAFLLSNCFCSAESDAFQTYTYSSRGEYQISPNTYQVNRVVDSIGEAGNLSRPTDIVVNRNMDVFIADTGNNRIVILDSHLNYKGEIKDLIDEQGEQTSLNAPQGIFISQQGFIYVCDTDNNRIVKLNADLTVDRIIKEPDKSSLPTNFEFKPTALAIDSTGRLNIVCQTTNMGILAMDEDSHFEGYVGAMRVSVNFFQLIKRIFMTEEQIRRSEQYVSSPYNNIQVDSRGFLYVTSSSISSESIQAAIRSNSASSTNAVIRKLTPSGTDVLVRNGHFPPVGAINFKIEHLNPNAGASTISEVAVSPDDQVYILVDSKYNKMFAYDQQGNLLYAFGGYGTVPGKFQQLSSVAFHGDELLALDSENNCITVFEKTAYGILLDKAISLQSQNQYSEAASVWKEVLKQNNNFDLAYVYIGKQLLQSGDYTTAMQYFYNTDMPKLYSQALSYQRAQWAEKWAIPLFIGILFVLIVLIVLFRKIHQVNLKNQTNTSKRKLGGELAFAFHVIVHPFDGFWDLKHERRGSRRSATIILGAVLISSLLSSLFSGYLFKGTAEIHVFQAAGSMVLPLILWCISNWCLTSLMDGSGSFSDIYIATCYSAVPYVLLNLLATALSLFLTLNELPIMQFIQGAAYFWMLLLLFFSSMTIHEYTLPRNALAFLLTILGIIVILFLILLFVNVCSRSFTFIGNLIQEITFRV